MTVLGSWRGAYQELFEVGPGKRQVFGYATRADVHHCAVVCDDFEPFCKEDSGQIDEKAKDGHRETHEW
jgi:hypothetical protein